MFLSYINKSRLFFPSILFLHELSLRCQHRHQHHSYPGTILFNKIHICIFISTYLLFKLIRSSNVLQFTNKKVCTLERIFWDYRRIYEVLSVSINIQCGTLFFKEKKTYWMCFGFCTHQCLTIIDKSYNCDLSFVDGFVRIGDFRVCCAVYEYTQITRCYLTDFWTLPLRFLI